MPQRHQRGQRLEVLSMVQGELDDGHIVTVLNVSEGGLLVHSLQGLAVDEHHELRFMSPDRPPTAMVFQARVAHVTPADGEDPGGWLVGLQFLNARTEQQRLAIQHVIALCGVHATKPD